MGSSYGSKAMGQDRGSPLSFPIAFVLAFAAFACSSSESTPSSTPVALDAGDAAPVSPDDASPPAEASVADTAVPACNALAQLDALITLEQVATAAPTPTGGAITDGTYLLTAYRRYTGLGGPSGPLPERRFHETATYKGTELQVNFGEPTFNVQETYKHEVSGNTFVHTRVCPAAPAAVYPGFYSATADTIRYFEDRGNGVMDEFAFALMK